MGEKVLKNEKNVRIIERNGIKLEVTSNKPSNVAIKNFNKFYNKHFNEFNK
ncbi:hypothetical protein SAMN05421787_12324 [Virgibacillus pantothenticus]|nr:hypothetical protein SAMN05421787_12324 [Virgibacillus pantothenticus]